MVTDVVFLLPSMAINMDGRLIVEDDPSVSEEARISTLKAMGAKRVFVQRWVDSDDPSLSNLQPVPE